MKRNVILFVLTLLCVLPVSAQTASDVLGKVVSKLESAPSLTMNMTLTGGGINESASLTMAKEKFVYKVGNLNVYYDGRTQWTLDKDEKEISLTEPTVDELVESNPLTFVRNYKKKYTAVITEQNSQTVTVKMTTSNKSAYVRSALVTINRSTWLPTRVDAQLATGQQLRINIVTATVGSALPIDNFRCKTSAYPIFEVIDLR